MRVPHRAAALIRRRDRSRVYSLVLGHEKLCAAVLCAAVNINATENVVQAAEIFWICRPPPLRGYLRLIQEVVVGGVW